MPDPSTEDAELKKRRPWYRLQLATWIALIAVGGTFLYGNARPDSWQSTGFDPICLRSSSHGCRFGWPMEFLYSAQITRTYRFPPKRPPERTSVFEFNPLWLTVNIVVAGMILGATGFLVESRLRTRRKWHQLTLQSLLILTAVVAAFLALFYSQEALEPTMGFFVDRIVPLGLPSSLASSYLREIGAIPQKFPLWVCIPLLFGIGCAFYLVLWVGSSLAAQIVSRLPFAAGPRRDGAEDG